MAAPAPDGRPNPITDQRLHTRTAAPETGGADIALTTESADLADIRTKPCMQASPDARARAVEETEAMRSVIVPTLIAVTLLGCSTRDITNDLNGSTAQRLVTHSVDDLVDELPDEELSVLEGKRVYLDTHFLHQSKLKDYADERLASALQRRFGARLVGSEDEADQIMTVFYNSLATDKSDFGLYIPLGFVPGVHPNAKINLLVLEKYHGISEMYYFIGETGIEKRSDTLQAVVRTDALGLPFITIPISNLEREQ